MHRASRMWTGGIANKASEDASKKSRTIHRSYSEQEIAQLKKETHRSQKQADASGLATNGRDASLRPNGSCSAKSLEKFLANLKADSKDKARRCNKDQKGLISRVVNQIIQDETYRMDRRFKRPEQFIHLLHGGPGTGKSQVIKLLKEQLFEKELQWTAGIDFQIAAFQAVNADGIDGDTLHHALG